MTFSAVTFVISFACVKGQGNACYIAFTAYVIGLKKKPLVVILI